MGILDRLFREDPLEAEYRAYMEKKFEVDLARQCGTGNVDNLDYYFTLGLFSSNSPVKRHREMEKNKECHIFMKTRYCYSNHPVINPKKSKKWGTSP